MAATEELIKLAARIVFQQVATPYRAALERRIIGAAICGILAFIAVLAAVACGVGAFWLWLAPKLGAPQAALVTMGILLLFALILGLLGVTFARRSPSKALQDVLSGKDFRQIGSLLEGHIPELAIAAALAGLVFSMRRRK